jgi:hypothetical protein
MLPLHLPGCSSLPVPSLSSVLFLCFQFPPPSPSPAAAEHCTLPCPCLLPHLNLSSRHTKPRSSKRSNTHLKMTIRLPRAPPTTTMMHGDHQTSQVPNDDDVTLRRVYFVLRLKLPQAKCIFFCLHYRNEHKTAGSSLSLSLSLLPVLGCKGIGVLADLLFAEIT